MRRLAMVLLLLFGSITLPLAATPAWATGGPGASFARTYGVPSSGFIASSIRQTTDGGFIVAGLTQSSIGEQQTWLVRLDATGAIVWQKGYAANLCSICSFFFAFPRAVQTPDGFIVASTANISSTTFPITIAAVVFKVDNSGGLVWQKAFKGLGNATSSSVELTADGGIVVAGATGPGIGSPGSGASTVALVLKLDGGGGLVWEKTYSGLGGSLAASIGVTFDGGLVVAGATTSIFMGASAWILRLSPDGSILWQEAFVSDGGLVSIQQTSDGGFIAAGLGPSAFMAPGGLQVLRLDSAGAPVWQKSYGGAGAVALSVEQASDGDFVVAGLTGLGTPSLGLSVLKLDPSGGVVWQRGFSAPSGAFSVVQTSDGGFAVAGLSSSQALVLRMNSKGEIHPCKDLSKSSLAASTLSTPPASITGAPVDITAASPGTTTTFTSTDPGATSTVLCHHGFKP